MRISHKACFLFGVVVFILFVYFLCKLIAILESNPPEIRHNPNPTSQEEKKDKPKKTERNNTQVPHSFIGIRPEELKNWYAQRYGVGKNLKPFILTEYKGGVVNRKDLEKTIRAVFQRLPNIRTNSYSVALLLETAEVETLRGKCVKNTISSATGIFQILPRTAKETLSWLSRNHKDIYDPLMKMYNKKLSLKDNLYQNVPFAIGMAATYYWRMNPHLWENISTMAERAFIWKLSYNTYYDKHGSAEGYLKTVAYCEDKKI